MIHLFRTDLSLGAGVSAKAFIGAKRSRMLQPASIMGKVGAILFWRRRPPAEIMIPALDARSASASGQIVCLRPWRERGLR